MTRHLPCSARAICAKILKPSQFCPTANDSRALNEVKGPCMIMAGAGMCTGGRIMHHFRYNLARPDYDRVDRRLSGSWLAWTQSGRR